MVSARWALKTRRATSRSSNRSASRTCAWRTSLRSRSRGSTGRRFRSWERTSYPGCRRVGVSWLFARPKRILAGYEGRIEHIELVYRAGGRVGEDTGGPWAFGFRLPRRPRPMRLAGQIG